MPDRLGHEWHTRWNDTRAMLVSTCQQCGAVEKASENGKVWMSDDIDPFAFCPNRHDPS